MPWFNPKTWTAGEVVSAADLNAHIRDNEIFLLNQKPVSVINRIGVAHYTTTSVAWADVDATNLSITLTCTTGRVLCWASFAMQADNTPSSSAEARFACTTATPSPLYSGDATHGSFRNPQNTNSFGVAITHVFTGLTAAPTAHTFRLQFRNVTAAAITTLRNDAYPVIFGAVEV